MSVLALRDGMRVAYQEWGASSSSVKHILALHGWLDNSNSFKMLGPQLAAKGCHVIAIDIPGHGKSAHLGPDANYTTAKSVGYVNEIVDKLGWEKPHILGHSMGAGISLAFAGTFPEKLEKLILIEGLGAVTAEPEACARNLRKAIEAESKAAVRAASFAAAAGGRDLGPGSGRVYPTFEDAVNARINVVSTYPGEQTLSKEAATWLVGRGAYLIPTGTGTTTGSPMNTELPPAPPSSSSSTGSNTPPTTAGVPTGAGTGACITAAALERDLEIGDGAVRFRYDPRLMLPTHVYLTSEQVASFCEGVTAQTLFVSAEKGWPLGARHQAAYEARVKLLKDDKGLMTHVHLPGSHHLHVDPATAPAVLNEISKFLELP